MKEMNASLTHVLPENNVAPKTYTFKVSTFNDDIKTVEWLRHRNLYIELENDVLPEFVDMSESSMKLFDDVYSTVMSSQENGHVCTDMILERTNKTTVYYNVITQDMLVWDKERYEYCYKHFEIKRILFHSYNCKNVLEWFKHAYDCNPIPEAFCFVIPKILHFQTVPLHKIKNWFNDTQINRVKYHNKLFNEVKEECVYQIFEECGRIPTRWVFSLLKIYMQKRDKNLFKRICAVMPDICPIRCKEYEVRDNTNVDEEVALLLNPTYERVQNTFSELKNAWMWGNLHIPKCITQ